MNSVPCQVYTCDWLGQDYIVAGGSQPNMLRLIDRCTLTVSIPMAATVYFHSVSKSPVNICLFLTLCHVVCVQGAWSAIGHIQFFHQPKRKVHRVNCCHFRKQSIPVRQQQPTDKEAELSLWREIDLHISTNIVLHISVLVISHIFFRLNDVRSLCLQTP